MKHFSILINIALILSVLIGDVIYLKNPTASMKAICSMGFVLLGLWNLIFCISQRVPSLPFPILLAVGLFLAMLGDVFISSSANGFLLGASLFALGHLFYFASYCLIDRFSIKDLLFSLLILTPCLIFLLCSPILKFDAPMMKWICIVYACIISVMVGKGISLAIFHPHPATVSLAVGSLLFCFSDLMLVLNWFTDLDYPFGKLCMGSYYPAQLLLALSTLLWALF